MGTIHSGSIWQYLVKLNICILLNFLSRLYTLCAQGNIPQKHLLKNSHIENWKQPKCPQPKLIHKLNYAYKRDYYMGVKANILLRDKRKFKNDP